MLLGAMRLRQQWQEHHGSETHCRSKLLHEKMQQDSQAVQDAPRHKQGAAQLHTLLKAMQLKNGTRESTYESVAVCCKPVHNLTCPFRQCLIDLFSIR